MVDIETVKAKAKEEVDKERSEAAVEALKDKYNELADAEQMVKNVKKEIEDLEASIADGSFAEQSC